MDIFVYIYEHTRGEKLSHVQVNEFMHMCHYINLVMSNNIHIFDSWITRAISHIQIF